MGSLVGLQCWLARSPQGQYMVYDFIVLSGALKGSFNLRGIKRLLALRGGKKVGQELRLRPTSL